MRFEQSQKNKNLLYGGRLKAAVDFCMPEHPPDDQYKKLESSIRWNRLLLLFLALPVLLTTLTLASLRYKLEYKVGDTVVSIEGTEWIDNLKEWANMAVPLISSGILGKAALDRFNKDKKDE